MKSFLVIGLGRFGRQIAETLSKLGNDVTVVDRSAELIELYSNEFSDAFIGDCTNEHYLSTAVDIPAFDTCIVAIGDDFQSSLVITSVLKQLGAKHIVAKAKQSIQGNLLQTIGADEVVYPERDIAERLAFRYNATNVFDFIKLTDDFAIYEIPVLQEWVGRSIVDVDIRKNFNLNIIAVKQGKEMTISPGATYIFAENDHMVVVGKSEDVYKVSSRA